MISTDIHLHTEEECTHTRTFSGPKKITDEIHKAIRKVSKNEAKSNNRPHLFFNANVVVVGIAAVDVVVVVVV